RSGQVRLAGDAHLGVFLVPAGQLGGEQVAGGGFDLLVVDGVGQAGELFEAQIAPAVHGDEGGAAFGGFGEGGADGGLVVRAAAVDADDDRAGAADLEFAAGGAHHDHGRVPVRDDGGHRRAEIAQDSGIT